MPYALVLPDGYGYAVAIALGVIPFLSFWQGTVVGIKRKAAAIPYPNPYATHEQAKKDPNALAFNCAQRAHGNLMENLPQTVAYTLFAGLFYPKAAASVAAFWTAARIVYMYGYIYGGKPNGSGRLMGSVFWLAQGGLWGMCLYAALTQLL